MNKQQTCCRAICTGRRLPGWYLGQSARLQPGACRRCRSCLPALPRRCSMCSRTIQRPGICGSRARTNDRRASGGDPPARRRRRRFTAPALRHPDGQRADAAGGTQPGSCATAQWPSRGRRRQACTGSTNGTPRAASCTGPMTIRTASTRPVTLTGRDDATNETASSGISPRGSGGLVARRRAGCQ